MKKKTKKYTITRLAKELGVTRQTIYYWIRKKWVTPGKDYRNYPVFSDKDMREIKKWHGAIKKEESANRQHIDITTPAQIASDVPLTWEEIQKILFK